MNGRPHAQQWCSTARLMRSRLPLPSLLPRLGCASCATHHLSSHARNLPEASMPQRLECRRECKAALSVLVQHAAEVYYIAAAIRPTNAAHSL